MMISEGQNDERCFRHDESSSRPAGQPLGVVLLFPSVFGTSLAVLCLRRDPGLAERPKRSEFIAETLASIGCWGRIACEWPQPSSVVALFLVRCGVGILRENEWMMSYEYAIIREFFFGHNMVQNRIYFCVFVILLLIRVICSCHARVALPTFPLNLTPTTVQPL